MEIIGLRLVRLVIIVSSASEMRLFKRVRVKVESVKNKE